MMIVSISRVSTWLAANAPSLSAAISRPRCAWSAMVTIVCLRTATQVCPDGSHRDPDHHQHRRHGPAGDFRHGGGSARR